MKATIGRLQPLQVTIQLATRTAKLMDPRTIVMGNFKASNTISKRLAATKGQKVFLALEGMPVSGVVEELLAEVPKADKEEPFDDPGHGGLLDSLDSPGHDDAEKALAKARKHSEIDPTSAGILDDAICHILARMICFKGYILTQHEFAIYNFYRSHFDDPEDEAVVSRYWESQSSERAQDTQTRNTEMFCYVSILDPCDEVQVISDVARQ